MINSSTLSAASVGVLAAVLGLLAQGPAVSAEVIFKGQVGNGCEVVADKEGTLGWNSVDKVFSSVANGGTSARVRYVTPPDSQYKLHINGFSLKTSSGALVQADFRVGSGGSIQSQENRPLSMFVPRDTSHWMDIDAQAKLRSTPASGNYILTQRVTCIQ